jgi:glycosyltransferase involved in cell wall biosynthesis
VVDDGSTDRTAEVAEMAGARVVRQPHRGPAAARNLGASQAHGAILVFTDADCRPEPGWLAALVRAVEAGADGAQGVYRSRQPGLVARFAQAEFEERYTLMRGHETIDLVATYAAAFRRDIFKAAGGFDESYTSASNEDTELSYRLVDGGKRLVLVEDAIVYHEHPASLGRYMFVKFWRAVWRMRVYRSFPGKAVRDRYTTRTVKAQTLLMVLWGVLLGVGAFWSLPSDVVRWACPAAVAVSSLPGAVRRWRRDRTLALFYPFGVLCRALALGCGAVAGLVRR